MKGSKPSGSTTTQQQVPQLPQLQEAWQGAQNIYQNATPANMIATLGDPTLISGIDRLLSSAYGAAELTPQANQMWQTGGTGSVYNSPAYNNFQNMAQGTTMPQLHMGNLGNLAQSVGAGTYGNLGNLAGRMAGNDNLGLSHLGLTAQGNFVNGNPWFSQMVQNALDPIARNFQTATAPQLDASFANSGRYGSGAMLGARENAQNTLADQLGKTSSNLYAQNYAQERQNQLAAAQQYGQLYNQGVAGAGQLVNAAADQYQKGLGMGGQLTGANLNALLAGAQGLQGGYQAGNAAALQAAQLYPSLAQGQAIPAELQRQAGQLYNAWQQQYLDQPSNAVDRYLKQLGAVQGGQSTTTPYFSNPMANAMAGITGGMDIMQKMGGMGGLGGSGGNPSVVNSPSGQWVAGTGMGSNVYTNMSNGYTSDQPGSGFPGIGAVGSGLSALGSIGGMMGGWIVCTELVKQGRMPRRYWATGSCAFMRYPEVGKRGYHLWGIPLVKHLRRKPYSLLSRIACAAFNWRAEDLAARRGIKGARRLLRGRLVTWTLYPICMALGTLLPAQDWQQVYRDDAGSRAAG